MKFNGNINSKKIKFPGFSFAYAWQIAAIIILFSFPGKAFNERPENKLGANKSRPSEAITESNTNMHKVSEAGFLFSDEDLLQFANMLAPTKGSVKQFLKKETAIDNSKASPGYQAPVHGIVFAK